MLQHHIPRSFLRLFESQPNRVWMVRRGGEPKEIGIGGAAARTNQYTTIGDGEPKHYEAILTGLENQWFPTVRRVALDRKIPTDLELQAHVTRFVALQHARAPASRNFMRDVVAPDMLQRSPNDPIVKGLIENPESDFPFFASTYTEIARILNGLPLQLCEPESGTYALPENPAQLILNDSGPVALLPLRPDLILQVGPAKRKATQTPTPVSRQMVDDWNSRCAWESQAVFGASRQVTVSAMACWE